MFLSSILNQPFIVRSEYFYNKLMKEVPNYGKGIWSPVCNDYYESIFRDLWLDGEGRWICLGPSSQVQHSFIFADNSSIWCTNLIGWGYSLKSSKNFNEAS